MASTLCIHVLVMALFLFLPGFFILRRHLITLVCHCTCRPYHDGAPATRLTTNDAQRTATVLATTSVVPNN